MKLAVTTPRLLYSYLAAEMLAPFFASFLIMNCVFFLVKLIPFLNFVLDLEIGVADFTRLFAYLFPNVFLYSIPMSAMLGVTIGFARLSSDSEILALKASGVSMYQIIPPVLVVTALIALLTSYFSIRLIPLSEISMKQLTYQLLKEKVNKGIKPHLFTEALGDVVVYVDEIDKENGEWQKVWVSDMRGVKNPVITMASTGSMSSDIKNMDVTIELHNGSLHRPDNKNAQILEFERYSIRVPLKPPESRETSAKRKDILNMPELLQEAAAIEEDSVQKRKFLVEFHKRLVLPAGCLLISILGLPLGLQSRPGRKAIGLQAALAIFILYYILFTFGRTMAEESDIPVVVAMWAPNFLFFVLAVYWLFRVANEKPLLPRPALDQLTSATEKLNLVLQAAGERCRSVLVQKEDVEIFPDDNQVDYTLHLHGDPQTKIFHRRHCPYYDEALCTLQFSSADIAEDAGFTPCGYCKDLQEDPSLLDEDSKEKP
jgi:lipopolysaccharide export system permease protein